MLMLISAFLAGAAFVILVELVIIYRWYRGLPTEEPKLTPVQKPVTNPKVSISLKILFVKYLFLISV